VALTQYILGVRADYEGLIVSPSIPSDWDGFEVTRQYRGATYEIKVENPEHVSSGVKKLTVNGKTIEGNRIPIAKKGRTVQVVVTLEG
jgi:cellobiose phosphorylase